MPPGSRPPTPPNIVRVAMTGDIGGQPTANVFHCRTDQNVHTSDGAHDFAAAFANATVAAGIIGLFHTSLHVTAFQAVIQLDADTAVAGTSVADLAGASSSTPLSAAMCAVLSWQSGAFWRGGKPRTYLGGIHTGFVDTNHSLADGQKNALRDKAAAWRDAINNITTPAVDKTELGLVSYASGKVWRSTPLFLPFTGVLVHDRLATQRRRLGPWLR